MRKHSSMPVAFMVILVLILTACTGGGDDESPAESQAATSEAPAESMGAESMAPEESEAPTGLAACGDPDSGDAFLIGGVTDVGQLEDKSFNEGGWCGTIAGATSVGGSAEVIVTADPADYAANIQTFIDQGYQIIVTYGFALGNATAIAAKENPDVWFIGLDQPVCVDENGDPDPTFACPGDAAALLPNYQGLIFSEAQAGYLAGIVAGTLTETNVIGTIGGIESIPAVKLYIGGYHNGALSVNPDVEVLISYVSEDITVAFNDPATGASLAEQMAGQDVDVLFQVAGLSGQGALEAACDAGGIYGIGVDVDQALALPNETCIVTSAEKKLVDAIDEAIQRIVNGEAVGGSVVLDAASDPPKVGTSPFHNHPDLLTPELQTLLDDATAAMAAGELDPCAGEGECPDFAESE
jgi:basic membrane protein A and related proteins